MIKNLILGDVILLKSLNNTGFVCSEGKIVYYHRMLKDKLECSLVPEMEEKKFITIREYQVATVLDAITGVVKYTHNVSDAL
jgi:hypothetical protein